MSKRIATRCVLYIDSAAWVVTASDQYKIGGELWKTLALFYAYRDRSYPDARVAIYFFRRVFETAMVDEDVQDGFSTVVYTPAPHGSDRECWYINKRAGTPEFFNPGRMASTSH
ncbi:MAG TPA: hypothetical protein VMA09_20500 [Candidatus Binataceae bacterium]|nr:hypothetical protein [Candidatus Binataceae bacterium]